jgi:hypothetical protein
VHGRTTACKRVQCICFGCDRSCRCSGLNDTCGKWDEIFCCCGRAVVLLPLLLLLLLLLLLYIYKTRYIYVCLHVHTYVCQYIYVQYLVD